MKKIVIILIILIGLGSIIQSCREDNIFQQVMGTVIQDDLVFKNQSDFEEFQENSYTEVIGNITILDSVTSLLPLNTLNIIRGNLLIKNTQLVTLNGLENLISISGDLSITSDFEQNVPIQNIENFCSLQNLLNEGMFGIVTIINNSFNPTVQDIINGDCIEEPAMFDCPDLEANFGDECFVDDGGNGTVGILSEDCECVVDGPGFDCEILEANIGDVCEAEFDFILFPGAVNEDCECELPDQQGGNCDMGLEVLDTNGEFNYTFSFAQLPESTTDHAWYIDGVFQGYNLGNELNYTFNSSGSHTIKVKAYLNSVDQSVFMTLCYNSIEIDL